MSASRRKVKKQLKKQNRSVKPQVPSLPKAKRKGGQYIYPAGAYRSVMGTVPPVKLLPEVIPVPEPVIEIPVPETPAAEEALTEKTVTADEQTETADTSDGIIPVWRQYMIPLAAAFALFAGFMAFRPKAAPVRLIAGAVKETASALTRDHELELSKADPLPELTVSVDLQSLKEPLEDYLSELSGDWAVYIRNLNTDEVLSVNDHQMPSASLIKLFTAGCYLEEVGTGRLEESWRSENDLAYMISWSDNNAWQDLETVIGGGNYINGLQMVTDFARAHGYENTGRLIGAASVYSADAENYTCVSETADVLRQIYEGTYVSEEASKKILDLMLDQHITAKIPAGLPEGIISANKTGELRGVENDAAIVWGQSMDYILVIMSDDNYAGTEPVRQLSSYIYGLLNPGFVES